MTRQYKEKMQTYCLVCKKNTENEDAKMVKSKNNKIMLMSRCAVCDNEKSKFVREQDAKGLLSNLAIKIPLLSALFQQPYKMNDIINKFLLTGDITI